jgi:hypothetical protein
MSNCYFWSWIAPFSSSAYKGQVCTHCLLWCAVHLHLQAAAQRKLAEASSPRKGAQRKPTGRRSSGSASLPSSSTTTASQAASSTSAAGSLQHPLAAPAAGAGSDNIVINIIPEVVPRGARPGRVAAAAVAAGGAAPMSVDTAASSSSNAAGTLSSSSTSHCAGAPHSGEAASSASTAQRMFTRLWRYQQQEVPEHMLQGPSTASGSHERALQTGITPVSSAAYTLSGSSSIGAVAARSSAGHASAGVISSLQQPGAYKGAAAPSQSGQTVSSSSTGAGTSGALSSHRLTVSSGGRSSTAAEIQPAPAQPVMGWLRRTSKQGRDVPDGVPGSDSGSSKTGSPAGPPKVEPSQSGVQPDRDELQVRCGCQGVW